MRMSKEKFDKVIKGVLATSEMEGLISTPEEVELLKDYATGVITEKEYDKKAMELINNG